MKILLIKPYSQLLVAKRLEEAFLHLEPLELEIVAGGVPDEDKVAIVDLSVEKKPIAVLERTLKSFSPDLVGISGYSNVHNIVKDLGRRVKVHNPDIVTVVGGVHATLLPDDYAGSAFDIIVRGEGGTVMAELIKRYKAGEPLDDGGRALSSKDPDLASKAAEPPPVYPEAEEIPRPRRNLVDRSQYFCVWTYAEGRRLPTMFPQTASLRTSIGCPYSCSFCVVHHLMNKRYLQRDPEDVVNEIEGLAEDHIYFVDDEMFINPDRVRAIAELLIERGVKKQYISWARADTICKHPDLFRLWKKAGLVVVYVGLESMEENRLDEYNKKVAVDTNRRAVEILKETGIMLHAALIVHPDFTRESFQRLEQEVKKLRPAEITFTVLSPSPGTRFWHDRKHEFICEDPFKFYDCMHSLLPTRLPLQRFYQHFGRLYSLALRQNPLRANKIKVPFPELLRAIVGGTKYIFSLYNIYKDYLPENTVPQNPQPEKKG